MASTDGNRSCVGPPYRGSCVETPSREKDVAVGNWPAIVRSPPLSVWTFGASAATPIGLGLAVARKFNARSLMASPDFESDWVSPSAITDVPFTSTVVAAALATA